MTTGYKPWIVVGPLSGVPIEGDRRHEGGKYVVNTSRRSGSLINPDSFVREIFIIKPIRTLGDE